MTTAYFSHPDCRLHDMGAGQPQLHYDGGRVDGDTFLPGRWDLLPAGRYMWASVQTVRGCPKHCSFCSVWRTDGQKPRQRVADQVLAEIVDLRRRGFRFIALADDNFYPVTLEDLRMADRRQDKTDLERLKAIRAERFELIEHVGEITIKRLVKRHRHGDHCDEEDADSRHALGVRFVRNDARSMFITQDAQNHRDGGNENARDDREMNTEAEVDRRCTPTRGEQTETHQDASRDLHPCPIFRLVIRHNHFHSRPRQ